MKTIFYRARNGKLDLVSSLVCLKSRHTHSLFSANGQTTVEFALILPVFFILLFAIIDYSQIIWYENAMQNAVREAARFTTSGSVIPVLDSQGFISNVNVNGIPVPLAIPSQAAPGLPASRNECTRWWFQSNCILKIPTASILVTSLPTNDIPLTVPNGKYADLLNPVFGPGNKNDYVEIQATYPLQTITPLFGYLGLSRTNMTVYNCHVSTIVKNEPALLNFQHTNYYPGEPGAF